MIKFPRNIKEGYKIIGYFSYTNTGEVICDGDACIIAGSEKLMRSYMRDMETSSDEEGIIDKIKKTKFSEIMSGLQQGGAYTFDEEAYKRFYGVAKLNGMNDLPTTDFFSEPSLTRLHFMRMQCIG